MPSAWLRVLTKTSVVRCALISAIKLAERVARGMAGPGQPLVAVEHRDIRRGAALGKNQIGARRAVALRHHETAKIVGLGDGRRQADAGQTGRDAEQPRQIEREQIAALRRHQRVQFVENDPLERAEQIRRIGGCEQERQLFRRRQQNIRRIAPLALALRGRRVAGAGLDADRQPHFRNRRFEVARDIDCERLERRNVERVQPAGAAHVAADGDKSLPRLRCAERRRKAR